MCLVERYYFQRCITGWLTSSDACKCETHKSLSMYKNRIGIVSHIVWSIYSKSPYDCCLNKWKLRRTYLHSFRVCILVCRYTCIEIHLSHLFFFMCRYQSIRISSTLWIVPKLSNSNNSNRVDLKTFTTHFSFHPSLLLIKFQLCFHF